MSDTSALGILARLVATDPAATDFVLTEQLTSLEPRDLMVLYGLLLADDMADKTLIDAALDHADAGEVVDALALIPGVHVIDAGSTADVTGVAGFELEHVGHAGLFITPATERYERAWTLYGTKLAEPAMTITRGTITNLEDYVAMIQACLAWLGYR